LLLHVRSLPRAAPPGSHAVPRRGTRIPLSRPERPVSARTRSPHMPYPNRAARFDLAPNPARRIDSTAWSEDR
jgi:hypothetical protein